MANELQVTISASIKGLVDGLKEASSSVREHTSKMSEMFDGLVETVEKVKGPLLALGAIFAGGKLFGEVVSETTTYASEVGKLTRILGITAAEASGLKLSLGKLGIDTAQYTGAVFKLNMALREKEKALVSNGVATRDEAGNLLSIQEVMQNGIARIGEMKKGYDANALSQLMFGRGAAELVDLQKLTNEKIAEGAIEARKLGIVMRQDGVEAARQYKYAIHDVHEVFESVKIRIGSEVIPVLTKLAHAFVEMAVPIADVIVGALKLLHSFLDSTVLKLAAVVLLLKGPVIGAFASAGTAVMRFVEVMRVQYALALAEGVQRTNAIGRAMGASTEAARQFGMMAGPTLGDKLKALGSTVSSLINWQMLLVAALVGGAVAIERYVNADVRAAKQGAEHAATMRAETQEYTRLTAEAENLARVTEKNGYTSAEAEKAKAKLELVIEQLNAVYPGFNKFLVDEAGHHRDVADAIRLANEERKKELTAKLQEVQLRINEAEARKRELEAQAADLRARAASKSESPMMADPRMQAAEQGAAGLNKMTAAALDWKQVKLDEALESDRKAVTDLAEALKALSGDVSGPKVKAGAYVDQGDIDKAAQQAARSAHEVAAIRLRVEAQALSELGRMDLKAQQDIDALEAIGTEEAEATKSLVIKKWQDETQQYIRNKNIEAARTFASDFSRGMKAGIEEVKQNWNAMKEQQVAAARATQEAYNNMARTIGAAFGAMAVGMADSWQAAGKRMLQIIIAVIEKSVMAKVVDWAAGAADSQATIPYVGPALAVAAAAAAFAAGEALIMKIPSAAGGYDIPSNINPLVQAHHDEMMLPEKYANVIRGLADGSSAMASGPSEQHIHNHYWSTMDGPSVRSFVESDKFRRAYVEAQRNGRLSK